MKRWICLIALAGHFGLAGCGQPKQDLENDFGTEAERQERKGRMEQSTTPAGGPAKPK